MDKNITFYCNYVKTIYRNEKNNYTIFSVKTTDVNLAMYEDRFGKIICKGYIPLYIQNMPLKIIGEIYKNKNNEYEIYVREITEEVESQKVAISYLSESCKSIGEKTARKIVEKLGINIFDYTKENLLTIVSEEKTNIILENLMSTRVQRDIFDFIARFGCSYLDAIKIYKNFGNIAMQKIRSNPYITHLPFSVKEKMALELDIDFIDERRIDGIVSEIFDKDLGHTYIDIKQLKALVRYLEKISPYDAIIPISLLMRQIYKNKGFIIEKTEPIKIFRKDMWFAETNIAKNIRRLENTKENMLFNNKIIEEIEKKNGIQYDRIQKNAIRNILSSTGFKVLTGGPGTGKTTTINAIIEVYARLNPDNKIVLCAPTGRAAQRMTETTRREAKTIHKTLKYSIKDNIVSCLNENDPIKANFIIVDEASMIDTKLLDMLLNAVQNGTLLLLVGDENQLSSVGAGNILHDIIDSERIQVTKLEKIFRQSGESSIITNCFKINDGDTNLSTSKDFQIINTTTNEELLNTLTDIIKKTYKKDDPYAVQVLSPSKKFDIGCNNINKILQKMLNYADDNKNKIYFGSNVFKINDKVILNRNNYESDTPYNNGDIGIIQDIKDNNIFINLNNRGIVISKEDLEDLSLSYDITIHKSQGSEYDTVIIILPINPINMLQRNLIFTAISRAKKNVFLITQENSLELAINNTKSNERKTTLKEKIVGNKNNIIFTGE